jgi:hypothetical protein
MTPLSPLGLPMWGRDFIPPPAFGPAFFGPPRDAGQKPGGRARPA